MAQSVTVGVRIRPLNDRELASSNPHVAWHASGDEILRAEGATAVGQIPSTTARSTPSSHSFRFDCVFDKHSTNEHVYDELGAPVVDSALGGFNSTIFAYGQTSSGKTHSMLGSPEDLGITPRAIRHVMHTAETSRTRQYLVRAVYVEIYNDRIRDLLNPHAADIAVREDKAGRVFVDAKETVVASFEDAIGLLQQGQAARHVGETQMNARSSRSHTVFTLHIESKNVDGLDASFRASSLNLVDLAGSERVKSTGATGARQKEGSHINQSLLVLGTIINRLSVAGSDPSKVGHLPYRDSKLTRLLRPALGGNARTAVLCAITPAAGHVEETLSTLKFAERAKKVTTNAKRNEVIDYRAKYKEASTEVSILRERFVALEKEMASLRASRVASQPSSPRCISRSEDHRSPSATFVATSSVTSSTSSPTPSVTSTSPGDADADYDYSIERVDGDDGDAHSSADSEKENNEKDVAHNKSQREKAMSGTALIEKETKRAVELEAARAEVRYLKAHMEEVDTENEHLRARLRLKNSEFNNLRARTVELRSMARSARSNERALYRVVRSSFNKLEEALSQLYVSRKKGAHVRVAEDQLQDLSKHLSRYAKKGAMALQEDAAARSQRQIIVRQPGTVATSGATNPIGKGSGAKGRNVMDGVAAGAGADAIGTATMLALRLGGISNETASFSLRPTQIRANASTRDIQPQRESSETSNAVATASSSSPNATLPMPTRRRPRPLPEDMVVDIDVCDSDADDTAFVTSGAASQSCKDSIDSFSGLVDIDIDSDSDKELDAVGPLSVEDNLSGVNSPASDALQSEHRTKKSRWQAIRSFYGYAERSVYDVMVGGHKVDDAANSNTLTR